MPILDHRKSCELADSQEFKSPLHCRSADFMHGTWIASADLSLLLLERGSPTWAAVVGEGPRGNNPH